MKVVRRFRQVAFAPIASLALIHVAASNPSTPPLQFGLTARVTATDNARADSAAPRADTVLELGPSVRYIRRAGEITGSLSYSAQGRVFARHSSENEMVHRLDARASWAPPRSDWSVDASIDVSQVARNPLTSSGQDQALVGADRADVLTLRLAPRWQGRLGSLAVLGASAQASFVESRNSLADSQALRFDARAASPADGRRVHWELNAALQGSETGHGSARESQAITGRLIWSPELDWRLSAHAGHEVNDYLSLDRQGYTTGGVGLSWRPSVRTRLEWQVDHRFFGAAHTLRAEYRTPRTVWNLSDSREFTTDALGRSQSGADAPRTLFDVLYAQFASVAPDPAQREALVDAFLQANGWTRGTLAGGGFLTASASVQRYRLFSMSWNGPRNSVVVSLSSNQARRADATSSAIDVLANGSRLNATAANLSLAHRLTPKLSLNLDLAATRNRTASASTSGRSRFHSAQLGLNWPLSPRQQASLSVRHAETDTNGTSRQEKAATFGLRMGF